MLLDHERVGNLIEGICQLSHMWNCRSFLDGTNSGKLFSSDVTKFVRKLYQANLDTWNKRYEESDTIPNILRATGEPFDKYQTLKTLQCLHYNIELEYVPAAKKLVDQLDIMINEITNIIVNDMPEYKTAEWG